MTENEIISYLKENKNKGVAFDFMPSEVKDWCMARQGEPIFNVYFADGWDNTKTGINCCYAGIYALTDDYEPKHEFKPDWQDFDIDEDGYFQFDGKKYFYRDDARFETENRDKFKGFGGMLFDEVWKLVPRVVDERGFAWEVYKLNEKVCPVTPTKIRFWRYAK